MDYIDDMVDSVNSWEARQSSPPKEASSSPSTARGKVLVGHVDQFFNKINVAAFTLTDTLKVGDIIEIGNEEEAIRQKVYSMQIEKENVTQADEGQSIGIKVKHPVDVGSEVYRLE